MTIHLPDELERDIRSEVDRGRFASIVDAMAEAARLLLRLRREDAPECGPPGPPGKRPIWERADELRRSIPAEEWSGLPVDGAAQLDHYLHGSPKRPGS
jgi:Arc/MetJ-type ribon-helix-helix transcriptional regulator